jgi:hypothetical protein
MASRMTAEQRKALPEEKREVIIKILKDNLPPEAVGDAAGSSAGRFCYLQLLAYTKYNMYMKYFVRTPQVLDEILDGGIS